MTTMNLVPSPKPVLSAEHRARFVAALAPLGDGVHALFHRVGIVDGLRVGYDAWSTDDTVDNATLHVEAQAALDDQDLSRPDKRQANRFGVRNGSKVFEAWFYDEARLLGRVILSKVPRRNQSKLRASARALTTAWRALAAEAQAAPTGTVVASPDGGIQAYDLDCDRGLHEGSELTRLVGHAVASGTEATVLLHGDTFIAARPLMGPTPTWLVHIAPLTPLALAPDAILTPTQRAVAEYAAVGATIEEIAKTLASGKETVRTHLKEIYRRLDVANRVELARALEA